MTAEGALGRLPSQHQLAAALRAGSILGKLGAPRAAVRESYRRIPSGGWFGIEDLVAGERLLVDLRLIDERNDWLKPTDRLLTLIGADTDNAETLLLAVCLDQESPVWLRAAAAGETFRPELLPDQESHILASMIPDPERREAFLLSLGRRADPEARSKRGEIGEEQVVHDCREQLRAAGHEELAAQVQRVSLISDQLGYDVTAPKIDGRSRRIEVKTTGGSGGYLEIVLSRPESRVGLSDSAWSLVICHLDRDLSCRVVGWCSARTIEPLLPTDQDRSGRWESARLILDPERHLIEGLPPVK